MWLDGPNMVNRKPVSPRHTRCEVEQVQPPPGDLTNHPRAKTTGEPSLVLAVGAIGISAIGAAREAVHLLEESLLEEKVAYVPLSTPLTPWTLLNAVWEPRILPTCPFLVVKQSAWPSRKNWLRRKHQKGKARNLTERSVDDCCFWMLAVLKLSSVCHGRTFSGFNVCLGRRD